VGQTDFPALNRTAISRPVPIRGAHDTTKFDCGKPLLTDWLKNNAMRSEGKSARTYVVCEGNVVVGYYCLATGRVSRAEVPKVIRGHGTPNTVPVVILGRLAVDTRYQKQGIGSGLLQDALRRALEVSVTIGAAAVLVHAIDDDAKAFYTSYGFIAFPADSRTLFLPMDTIGASL
jgi:GNAT superfamily N-acetyltransferase